MAEEVEETIDDSIEEPEDEEVKTGYVCVSCEEEVEINPVEDKIICPSCSHRVLLKKRPEQGKTVKAR
ncbi:MAG: DNA-directed RNA polymerase subunit RPC12/RpoP [Candidatus Nanohaloarchaea archaeon]|jgi:DNA-directed RNA polymerase subunit RPC12/RpoP